MDLVGAFKAVEVLDGLEKEGEALEEVELGLEESRGKVAV